jgi:hypothetical protein
MRTSHRFVALAVVLAACVVAGCGGSTGSAMEPVTVGGEQCFPGYQLAEQADISTAEQMLGSAPDGSSYRADVVDVLGPDRIPFSVVRLSSPCAETGCPVTYLRVTDRAEFVSLVDLGGPPCLYPDCASSGDGGYGEEGASVGSSLPSSAAVPAVAFIESCRTGAGSREVFLVIELPDGAAAPTFVEDTSVSYPGGGGFNTHEFAFEEGPGAALDIVLSQTSNAAASDSMPGAPERRRYRRGDDGIYLRVEDRPAW